MKLDAEELKVGNTRSTLESIWKEHMVAGFRVELIGNLDGKLLRLHSKLSSRNAMRWRKTALGLRINCMTSGSMLVLTQIRTQFDGLGSLKVRLDVESGLALTSSLKVRLTQRVVRPFGSNWKMRPIPTSSSCYQQRESGKLLR